MRVRLCLVGMMAAMLLARGVVADTMLFVAPLRVEFDPAETTEVITVTNKSDQTKRYQVILTDQAMTAEGVTQTVDTFPYSSKKMLRFMPRRVVLEPGQRQVVRVMARRPADLPDGDYHTHLLFEEEQPSLHAAEASGKEGGFKLDVGAIYSVAVPVVVRAGKLESSMELLRTELKPASDKAPAHLLAAFKRHGNAEASGFLTVTAAKGGQELIAPRMVRLYREVDDAVLTLPLTAAGETYKGPAVVRLMGSADKDATVLAEQTTTF